MNFVCDKCKQKYHVADEKIRGRAVTRFRCKKCENVIELRADWLPPVDTLPAAPPSPVLALVPMPVLVPAAKTAAAAPPAAPATGAGASAERSSEGAGGKESIEIRCRTCGTVDQTLPIGSDCAAVRGACGPCKTCGDEAFNPDGSVAEPPQGLWLHELRGRALIPFPGPDALLPAEDVLAYQRRSDGSGAIDQRRLVLRCGECGSERRVWGALDDLSDVHVPEEPCAMCYEGPVSCLDERGMAHGYWLFAQGSAPGPDGLFALPDWRAAVAHERELREILKEAKKRHAAPLTQAPYLLSGPWLAAEKARLPRPPKLKTDPSLPKAPARGSRTPPSRSATPPHAPRTIWWRRPEAIIGVASFVSTLLIGIAYLSSGPKSGVSGPANTVQAPRLPAALPAAMPRVEVASPFPSSDSLYVSVTGAPNGDGSRGTPFRSITDALRRAQRDRRHHLIVDVGVYVEDVSLVNGVSMHGGYDRASAWSRPPDTRSTIVGSSVREGSLRALLGERITAPTLVERFVLQTRDASRSGTGRGVGGIWCPDCPGLILDDSIVRPTAGAPHRTVGGGQADASRGRVGRTVGSSHKKLPTRPNSNPLQRGRLR